LRELHEETGIGGDGVTSIASGRPIWLELGEEWGRRSIIVHPVAINILPTGDFPPPVVLNWENSESRWVEFPDEELRGVPRLVETHAGALAAVSAWNSCPALERIRRNRHSGATALAVEALEGLAGAAAVGNEVEVAYQLATVRPAMSPLANAVMDALAYSGSTLREACASVTNRLRAAEAAVVENTVRVVLARVTLRNGGKAAGKESTLCILTCSYSGTVRDAILRLHASGRKVRVIVAESRPLCEGARLGYELAELGIAVEIITDAQVALFAGEADVALVGADGISAEYLVNKAGTHALSAFAKERGVPVLAAAVTWKVTGTEGTGILEEKDAREVTKAYSSLDPSPAAAATARVRNVYFERVPLGAMTAVITEQPDQLGSADIRRIAAGRRAQFQKLFYHDYTNSS